MNFPEQDFSEGNNPLLDRRKESNCEGFNHPDSIFKEHPLNTAG